MKIPYQATFYSGQFVQVSLFIESLSFVVVVVVYVVLWCIEECACPLKTLSMRVLYRPRFRETFFLLKF